LTEINPDVERLVVFLSGRIVAAEMLTEANWQHIVELAQKQGVAQMLYARLKECGVTPPQAAAQRLQEIYYLSIIRNTRMLHELRNILHALQAADIPVILLKGACLAEVVYGNIALRTMDDVDLLVKPADLARALDVLRTLGYVAAHPFEIESERHLLQHMPPLSKRGGVTLELHWTMVDPRHNLHFDDNDLEQVWSRATPVKIGDLQVLMPSPADLLWHLCLHASVQHYFNGIGLRGFWDIALVIRRYGQEIDWEQFTRRVNQWGMANGVYLALKLTEEWTDVVMPTSVMYSLMPTTLDDTISGWVRHKIWNETSPAIQGNLASIVGKKRLTDRLAALRDSLFPSRHRMASMYHLPEDSWRILCYYPLRFKDLCMRHSQVMWQLLRRDRTLIREVRQEARLREYVGGE